MNENRDQTGRADPASAAAKGPEHSAHEHERAGHAGSETPQSRAARLVNEAVAAESTQPRQVLMQRVIALTGVVEAPESAARQRASALKAETMASPAKAAETDPARALVDLSATALEWGARQPVRITTKASKPAESLPEPDTSQAKEALDAQWATHSSISLELCDLSRSVLSLNIEDAVTQQYHPRAPSSDLLTTGSSINDLASLDRVLEAAGAREAQERPLITKLRDAAPATAAPPPAPPAPPATPASSSSAAALHAPARAAAASPPVASPAAASSSVASPAARSAAPASPSATWPSPPASLHTKPAPRLLVVPASVAWTVAAAFTLCTLVLAYLVVSTLVCGQASLFDPLHFRCVARANVAQVEPVAWPQPE